MRVKFARPVLAFALGMLTLAGCADPSDMEAQSAARWKAFCAAKGKQFLWHDTVTDKGLVMMTVTAQGKCVGPGERGYLAPVKGDDDEP